MTDYIKYGLIAAAVGLVYLTGYHHAETEGERKLEEVKVAHSKAIIAAQEAEKVKYEETIKGLLADLDSVRGEHDRRMHELQNFRARATDHETCTRQRADLARVAVELERVASRALTYLEGGSK